MKALSVKQPWAFLLITGVKKVEVRSWSTQHRGDLLIHASASPKDYFWHDPEDDTNRLLHAGCLIGAVELIEVRKLTKEDSELSLCDYQPGAYAWVIEPICFLKPVKTLGKLRMFDVDESLVEQIPDTVENWLFSYPTPQGEIKYTDKCSRWA